MSDSLDNFEQPRQTNSRLGSKITAGEIVEVQGGHIVRSIGRKDRHSKVCTAKGPRDRRVRLSAHTAIQFYDVQDRLGYDRPSKAVDWLIKKAKTAIDELAELPAWNPTTHLSSISNLSQEQPQKRQLSIQQSDVVGCGDVAGGSSSKRAMTMTMAGRESEAPQGLQQQQQCSNFLPPSLDSDSIADTIKSFFPVGGGASNGGSSSRMQFQGFPPTELLSRSSSQSQELRLSLQSFQDPISLHHHQQQHHVSQNQNQTSVTEQQTHVQGHSMFSGASNLGFDVSGWSEQQQQPIDFSRFQRLNAWNSCGDAPNNGGAAGGYLFSSQPLQQQQPLLQQILGQNQVFSQRGPLQSSNSPSFRAWMDPSMLAIATADHNIQQQQQQQQQYQSVHPIYPSSSAIGFASGIGGISGSFIPARIRGEREEQHDGLADKPPSSASSDSHH